MKFLLAHLASTVLFISIHATPLPSGFDWSGYNQDRVAQLLLLEQSDKRLSEYTHMQLSKESLINGNLSMAKFHLTKVRNEESKLYRIKLRYMALIHFIEGNIEKSLELLNNNLLAPHQYYSKVCTLKMAIYLAKADAKSYRSEQRLCNQLNQKYGKNEFIWTETLSLILNGIDNMLDRGIITSLRRIFGSIDYLYTWMKLALFVNEEQRIIESVYQLPARTFKSQKIRELIGFAYYRQKNYEEAQKFIEDINSPNADNIRGNIMLKDNKLELAYGHFQLALAKRENSLNALERSIPLSWMLKQWEKGLGFTRRLFKKGLDENKKLALLAAFHIQLEQFKDAERKLEKLNETYVNFPPKKVQLMNSYVSLRKKDNTTLQLRSKTACEKGDGTNCWLYHQVLRWENLGQTIERSDKVITKVIDIDSLKTAKEIKPMVENVTIDQSDIEELDGQITTLDF